MLSEFNYHLRHSQLGGKKRLIEEREILATEIGVLLTRIDILTEECDVAEENLDDALFEIEGLKEEINRITPGYQLTQS